MAITAKPYGLLASSLATGLMNLSSDTLKVMLCSSGYTPNQDTHQYKSSVTSEVAGTGYTAGGATLAGVSLVYDATTNTLRLDANDVTWADSTITARYAVVYDDTATNDPLIMYVDFGTDMVSSAGPFTIEWDAAGLTGFQAVA